MSDAWYPKPYNEQINLVSSCALISVLKHNNFGLVCLLRMVSNVIHGVHGVVVLIHC